MAACASTTWSMSSLQSALTSVSIAKASSGFLNWLLDCFFFAPPQDLSSQAQINRLFRRPGSSSPASPPRLSRFMKLRLDRVLTETYEADCQEEALASNPVDLEFEKPEKWVAPCTEYDFGWWEPFLPPGSQKPKA